MAGKAIILLPAGRVSVVLRVEGLLVTQSALQSVIYQTPISRCCEATLGGCRVKGKCEQILKIAYGH